MEIETMKRALIVAVGMSVLSIPTATRAEGLPPADPCRDTLSLACVESYARQNQANVSKIIGDLTAGRPPVLPAPALPGLEKLPSVDLGKLLPKP